MMVMGMNHVKDKSSTMCVCVCVLPVPVDLSFQALDGLRPFFALRSHKVLREPCVTSLSFPVMLPLIIMKENLTK